MPVSLSEHDTRADSTVAHVFRGTNPQGVRVRSFKELSAEELVHHSDRLDALREDADGRAQAVLLEKVALVDDTRARLALNVSEELALEALAYRLES